MMFFGYSGISTAPPPPPDTPITGFQERTPDGGRPDPLFWEIVGANWANPTTYTSTLVAATAVASANHYAEVRVLTAGDATIGAGPVVRSSTDAKSGYWLQAGDTRLRLWKLVNGTATLLDVGGLTQDYEGKLLRLTAIGSLLTATADGALVGSWTDATNTTQTRTGISGRSSNVTASSWSTGPTAAESTPVGFSDRSLSGVASAQWQDQGGFWAKPSAGWATLVGAELAGADHFAETKVALSLSGSAAGPTVRLNANGTQGYVVSVLSDRVRLYALTGTLTTITDFASGSNHGGKTIRLEAVGNTLTVYANGVQIGTATDTTYPTNLRTGVTGTNAAVAEFATGMYVPPTTPPGFNERYIGGTPVASAQWVDVGPNWEHYGPSFTIVYDPPQTVGDHWAETRILSATSDPGGYGAGPAIRMDPATGVGGFAIIGGPSYILFYEMTEAGGLEYIATWPGDPIGKTVRLAAQGPIITGYLDGSPIGTHTTTKYLTNTQTGVLGRWVTLDNYNNGVFAPSGSRDMFNRANNTNPATAAPIPWAEFYGNGNPDTSWTIASKALAHTTSDWSTLVGTTELTANHFAEVFVPNTVGVTTPAAGPAVRLNANGTQGYVVSVWSDRVRLYALTGTLTTITDFASGSNHGGKTIRLEAVGDTLTVYANGVQIGTTTDTTWPTNLRTGLHGRNVTGVDSFLSGSSVYGTTQMARLRGSRQTPASALAGSVNVLLPVGAAANEICVAAVTSEGTDTVWPAGWTATKYPHPTLTQLNIAVAWKRLTAADITTGHVTATSASSKLRSAGTATFLGSTVTLGTASSGTGGSISAPNRAISLGVFATETARTIGVPPRTGLLFEDISTTTVRGLAFWAEYDPIGGTSISHATDVTTYTTGTTTESTVTRLTVPITIRP